MWFGLSYLVWSIYYPWHNKVIIILKYKISGLYSGTCIGTFLECKLDFNYAKPKNL